MPSKIKYRYKHWLSKTLMLLFLAIVLVIVLAPFLWMIANSFKPTADINRFTGLGIRTFIPENPTTIHYTTLFNNTMRLDFTVIFMNTITVGLLSVVFNFFINTLAAYAFARIDFFGRKVLFVLVLLMLIIPFDLLILTQYILIRDFNLLDTLWAIIVPSIANPFMIFFLRQFFLEIPKELEDAAVIDGCGPIKVYYKIMLPLVTAPVLTILIIVFLNQWNNFIWPTTVISNLNNYVLQMAVQSIAVGQYITDNGILYAGAVISIIPIIILFILIQKYYIQSIISSGIKG